MEQTSFNGVGFSRFSPCLLRHLAVGCPVQRLLPVQFWAGFQDPILVHSLP